ncbi:MAG: tetraacyldisaccharide 4'-kinase, partial [Gammaproteobacteria bacterium]|nr:tetraacyldisaccharide 4'-kinase [Gammaproteobacteria bacterium]
MNGGVIYRWLHRVWYEGAGFGWLLLPFTALYWFVSTLRRWLYRSGFFKVHRLPVPVIVIGNITAGGTGKTPTAAWLAGELRNRGFSPGIVSRGYGGSGSETPMRVEPESKASLVGDEPVLLARRTLCPVAVGANRVRAAEILADDGVDLIVADDGLQHYRLARDYEICVIDGARGLGNRRLLPAGPLRESQRRLTHVDQVLVNGPLRFSEELSVAEQNAAEFELVATEAIRLNGSLIRPLERFAGETVHAVAGIGNPSRFFEQLRAVNIEVIEHPLPDHAALKPGNLEFNDDFPVFMTEKDAVRLDTRVSDRFWYIPVELEMDPALAMP